MFIQGLSEVSENDSFNYLLLLCLYVDMKVLPLFQYPILFLVIWSPVMSFFAGDSSSDYLGPWDTP